METSVFNLHWPIFVVATVGVVLIFLPLSVQEFPVGAVDTMMY